MLINTESICIKNHIILNNFIFIVIKLPKIKLVFPSLPNGAGIFTNTSANILSSTITQNTATVNGGGILNNGITTLISSQITQNNAFNGEEYFQPVVLS